MSENLFYSQITNSSKCLFQICVIASCAKSVVVFNFSFEILNFFSAKNKNKSAKPNDTISQKLIFKMRCKQMILLTKTYRYFTYKKFLIKEKALQNFSINT